MSLFVFILTTTTSQNIQHFVALDRVYWRFILQGTWLGFYLFLALINDLATSLPTFTHFNITLTEVLAHGGQSELQVAVHQLTSWSRTNYMNINTKGTKEILTFKTVRLLSTYANGTLDQIRSFM